MGQSEMNHPEKLETYGTQDGEKQKTQHNMCRTPFRPLCNIVHFL